MNRSSNGQPAHAGERWTSAAGFSASLSYEPHREDVEAVATLVRASGFFTRTEQRIATELVRERLAHGETSGYRFVLLRHDGHLMGYTCYGHIDGTESSYDLYWIAVDTSWRGQGVGTVLIAETEALVARAGGRRLYVETSSRPLYEPTRRFYLRRGYLQVAFLPDFYAQEDGKVIYAKQIESRESGCIHRSAEDRPC